MSLRMTTTNTTAQLPSLAWQLQKKLTKSVAPKQVIDLASASGLHLDLPQINMKQLAEGQLARIGVYPGRISIATELTATISETLKKWTGASIPNSEIMITSGIYGAYRTILLSSPKPLIIVPELTHEPHKAAFKALGKRLLECPADPEGRMDLGKLRVILGSNREKTAYVYICHNRGQLINEAYLLELSDIICKAKTAGLYDADIIYTTHTEAAQPWLPFITEKVRSHMLIMGTLSKEFGMPGIRIGYVVGSARLMDHIKVHQEETLEMIPAPSQIIASHIMGKVRLDKVQEQLQDRMKTLVRGLSGLGWKVSKPAVGINLRIPVPPSFAKQKIVAADELFSWYTWQAAGVLIRIGSTDGTNRNTEVRLVICQTTQTIDKAIQQLLKAGITYDMKLPEDCIKNYLAYIR